MLINCLLGNVGWAFPPLQFWLFQTMTWNANALLEEISQQGISCNNNQQCKKNKMVLWLLWFVKLESFMYCVFIWCFKFLQCLDNVMTADEFNKVCLIMLHFDFNDFISFIFNPIKKFWLYCSESNPKMHYFSDHPQWSNVVKHVRISGTIVHHHHKHKNSLSSLLLVIKLHLGND